MSTCFDTLEILTLNIGGPSLARAERQLEWLEQRPEDVIVLTETSDGPGSRLISDRYAAAGWDVRFPPLPDRERGVMLASRIEAKARTGDVVSYLPARAEGLALASGIEVVGVYVPSRDESTVKTERKERFVRELAAVLARRRDSACVVVGDLNVLEPDHYPRYSFFREWEYALYRDLANDGWTDAYRAKRDGPIEHSWVGRDNDGYRFDHVFVSAGLCKRVRTCEMLHATRAEGLTDHSALTLTLASPRLPRLEVAASLSREPAALF